METKKLLMGNEAIALGAIKAGVQFVSGYPGTPSSEILETIIKQNLQGVYAEWSVNEKSALEVAAGASMAGARSMVTMKQVGLNVASDPLMSLNYVGIKGGMVVVVADDPGPISSQTEQDTRHFGIFAKLVVFDPSSPEEAYTMIADAFECSEKIGRPVLFRPTTRVCHSYASVTLDNVLSQKDAVGFSKEGGRWAIFPRLSFENHKKIEQTLQMLSDDFSNYGGNFIEGNGNVGIATGGVSYLYTKEVLDRLPACCKLMKISTFPFPKKLGLSFLKGLDRVLVIEELDPVIERELLILCGENGIKADILGKKTGHIPEAGENATEIIEKAVREFLSLEWPASIDPTEPPPLPLRPPVLCAGCPHRSSFYAVKEAAKGRKAVFSGDIGCYTLGNAQPLDMVDTCLCMGAGITMAQGLNRIEPDTVNFAFIGDSTFFHTGIAGIVNAVYNGSNIIVAILDNSTTAMTGNQPHPGMGINAMREIAPKISIYDIVKAIGVNDIQRVNAFDFVSAKAAVSTAMDKKGVRVILFEGPCIAVNKSETTCTVDREKCTGCKSCIRKLGCPALSMDGKKAVIDRDLCTGCGLCKHTCAFAAIIGGGKVC